jgi:hypothetical protein
LAQALEQHRGAQDQAFITTPREPGDHLSGLQEYSLEEVIKEYQHLRRVIVNVLHQEPDLDSSEVAFVHDAIDAAVQTAAGYAQKTQHALRETQARPSAVLASAQLGTFEWNVVTDAVTLDDHPSSRAA